MNEREIALCKKSNAELGKEEIDRILMQVAEMKRVSELVSLLPEEYALFTKDTEAFVKEHGFSSVSAYDLNFTFGRDYYEKRVEAVQSEKYLELVPEAFFRFRQFVLNKYSFRNLLKEKLCDPEDKKVSTWRKRQINRCNGAIGGTNLSLIHSLFCFEIASGCSIGCEFCGLGAKKLSSVYRYNDENAELFRDVMKAIKKRFGVAGTTGMLYYATEPLDNPDYEKFEQDYQNIMGVIPQITTAAATRNIERTRKLVENINGNARTIHRFSITSKEMAKEILDSFSPVELIKVELIPQYKEAPGFAGFVSSGHAIDHVSFDRHEDRTDAGTISAIDGFCVNFCDKTIYLFTPVRSDTKNPNGIHIFEKVTFIDAKDFEEKLEYLINKYMVNEVSNEDILKLYDYFEIERDGEKTYLISKHGGERLCLSDINNGDAEKIVKIIGNKVYTRREIAGIMYSKYDVKPEVSYNIISQLWKNGYIAEKELL